MESFIFKWVVRILTVVFWSAEIAKMAWI